MKKVIGVIVSLIVLGFMVSCEPGGAQIVRITPDESELVPGESTILRSEIDNPEASELEYAWEADAGTIENLGDSARWTAPDFLWMDSTVTVTLTIEDTEGNLDDEDVSLEVQVNRQELEATDDTYTFSYAPDDSYDTAGGVFVGYDAERDGFFHAFFNFPTPSAPAGETVHGARICLHREWGEGDECALALYLVEEDWQGSNVTWNNEPNYEQFLTVNDDVSDKGSFYIPITSLVTDWMEGNRINNGLMLGANDESDFTHRFREYISIEGPSDERPVLEVVSW